MFEFIKDFLEAFLGVFKRRPTFSNYPYQDPFTLQLNSIQHQWAPPIDYSIDILVAHLQDLQSRELTTQWNTEIPNDIY